MKGLWIQPRDGKPFYRTRKGGKVTLVPLPDLPHDHPDFVAAWAEAARTHKPPEKPKAGTLASMWTAALASPQARLWSESYRSIIARQAALIVAKAGTAQGRAVRPVHIAKDIDDAPNPLERHKAWRFFCAWAKSKHLVDTDHALAVPRPKQKRTTGYPPWTEEHLAAFRARWPIGTVARAAMELMAFCGCRISDAVLIGPQMVAKDGTLSYRQKKTGDFAYAPWACPLPHYAAHLDRDMLQQALAPFVGHLTFLATRAGRPRSAKALSTLMQGACKDAGIPVSAHGLRKYRAIDLMEHGATTADASSWTGHHSLAELEHYIRERDRRRAVVGTAREHKMEAQPIQVETRRAK